MRRSARSNVARALARARLFWSLSTDRLFSALENVYAVWKVSPCESCFRRVAWKLLYQEAPEYSLVTRAVGVSPRIGTRCAAFAAVAPGARIGWFIPRARSSRSPCEPTYPRSSDRAPPSRILAVAFHC